MTTKESGAPSASHFSSTWFSAFIVVLIVASLSISWWSYEQNRNHLEQEAIQQADEYLQLMMQIRAFYSREIVPKAKDAGMRVGHDYAFHNDMLPLPTSFTMDFARNLMAENTGLRIRLFSELPFPWNKSGGPQDTFENDALRALHSNSFEPFYQFDDKNDQLTLRYARADILSPSCVACHNSYPGTPKRDWKAGDVRGVMSVTRNISTGTGPSFFWSLTFVQTLFSVLALGLLWYSMSRLHKSLRHAEALNDKTLDVNKRLQSEIQQRSEAEQELRLTAAKNQAIVYSVADSLMLVDQQWRIQQSNPAGCQLLRSNWEQLRQQPLTQYFNALNTPPDHWLPTGNVPKELQGLRPDGSSFPVMLQINKVANSQPALYVVVIRDISEQKTLEMTLAEARDQALASSQIKSEFLRKMEQLNSELELRVNERTQALQDANLQLQSTAAALEEERRSQQQLIQHWQQAQAQLLQQEKLVALGQVTSGVISEIHAPLAFALYQLQQLQSNGQQTMQKLDNIYQRISVEQPDSPLLPELSQVCNTEMDMLDQHLTTTLAGLNQVEKTVKELQHLAEAEQGGHIPMEVNSLITSVLEVLRTEISERILIQQDFAELPPYQGNVLQLSQLMIHLLIQAEESLQGNGRLRIRTRQEEEDIQIELEDAEGDATSQWQSMTADSGSNPIRSLMINELVQQLQAQLVFGVFGPQQTGFSLRLRLPLQPRPPQNETSAPEQ
ncbi:c-type heme family protein [Pokkaliibacter plantistimulans]|uniref:c-type heme family protein n=1 Tax=Pokkaliibacter plantistimulans TaxID=1635171 RepID=UPI0011B0A293|nr:DUF3365 domain-containing protein [Pokkaliibacter plantistimulans]